MSVKLVCPDGLMGLIAPSISTEKNFMLIAIPFGDVTKTVVFAFKNGTSPNPHGKTCTFYKSTGVSLVLR